MRWVRRLWRSALLAGRWAGYLARGAGREPVFGDFYRWWRTTVGRTELSEIDLPWLTFAATRFLAERLRPGWRVFEWGSGASTLFFIRRGCRVTAAEHDAAWAERLRPHLDELAARGLPRARLLLFPDAGSGYLAAIGSAPEDTYDLVVVDGRERGACLLRALPWVRPGGWLVLDDSEREAYRPAIEAVPADEWRVHHFVGPRPSAIWPVFSRTTAWRRRGVEVEP